MSESFTQQSPSEVLYPEQPGRIRSPSHMNIARALGSFTFFSFFGGVILTGLGVERLLGDLSQSDTATAHALTGIMVGLGVCLLVAFTFGVFKQAFFINRWMRRVACREIKSRARKLIDPDAGDSRFVALVSRSQWECSTLFNATDVGFLAIDYPNKAILFEGDNECYRIPARNIIESKQEYSSHNNSIYVNGGATISRQQRYFFVVISAKIGSETRELAFRILAGKGMFTQDGQGAANLSLLTDIHRIQGLHRDAMQA